MEIIQRLSRSRLVISKDKFKAPLICVVLLILLAFTPLKVLSLIGCIVLWAIYWPFPRLVNSLVLRLVLAFVLTTCYQQLAAALFWLVRIDFTVPVVVSLELAAFLALVAAGYARPVFSLKSLFSRADMAAASVAVISSGLIMYFMLSGGPLLPQLVRQVTTGHDNAQHVSLTQTLYENKGYLWGPIDDVIDRVKYWNLGSYPQGWSLATSVWWQALTPSSADIRLNPGKVLGLYVGFFMAWYTLTVYLFCRLIIGVVDVMRRKVSSPVTLVGAFMFTALAEIAFLIYVLYNGFASFMPALLFSLTVAYLILASLKSSEPARPMMFIVAGLMAAGGVAFSWLLVAPAVYLMVLIGVVAIFHGSFVAMLRWVVGKPWRLPIALVLVGLASVQGYVQLAYGVDDLVNMPGGINEVNILFQMAFLTAGLAAVLYYRRTEVSSAFIAIASGGMITAGTVFLFQFFSSGVATYFSTKAAYVPLMLLVAFGSAAIISLAEDLITTKAGQFLTGTLLVAMALFLPIATKMALETTPAGGIGSPGYLAGKRFLSPESAALVSELLVRQEFKDGDRLIMFKHLGYAEDMTTSHFANVVTRVPNEGCNDVITTLGKEWRLYRDQVLRCAGDGDVYIVVSLSTLKETVDMFANDPRVKVVLRN